MLSYTHELCCANQIYGLDKNLSKRFGMCMPMYNMFLPFRKVLGRHTLIHGGVEVC